jgi:hypothetical protein
VTSWTDPRTGMNVYRPLRRYTRLKPRSAKLAAAMRVYNRERELFLEANPNCQHPTNHTDKSERSTVVHHQRGRFGKRLLDKRWWKASCWACNDEAETDTGKSLKCGWLVLIESVQ